MTRPARYQSSFNLAPFVSLLYIYIYRTFPDLLSRLLLIATHPFLTRSIALQMQHATRFSPSRTKPIQFPAWPISY